jgi:hypothetical protein
MPQEALFGKKNNRFCELIICSYQYDSYVRPNTTLLSYLSNLPFSLTDDKSNRISNVKTSNQVRHWNFEMVLEFKKFFT